MISSSSREGSACAAASALVVAENLLGTVPNAALTAMFDLFGRVSEGFPRDKGTSAGNRHRHDREALSAASSRSPTYPEPALRHNRRHEPRLQNAPDAPMIRPRPRRADRTPDDAVSRASSPAYEPFRSVACELPVRMRRSVHRTV